LSYKLFKKERHKIINYSIKIDDETSALFARHRTLRSFRYFERSVQWKLYALLIHDRFRARSLMQKFVHAETVRTIFLPTSMSGAPLRRAFDSKRPLPTAASSSRPVTILFFGGLWKGPLLQELEMVSNALGEGQVLVVQGGRGSLRPDEVTTRKFVISTRSLPFDKINEYIATADVGLALYPERTANNSRYTAFAGEKVARYAQCGVPFIAFRSEDYEFLKAETECCELVDDYGEIPAAINKILDNYESYRRGAYAAYDRFYRIENTGAEVLRALDPTQNDLARGLEAQLPRFGGRQDKVGKDLEGAICP